jgi:hypothetical protein
MTDSGPDQPAPEVVPLDLGSFTYAERLELQREFDIDFADIWDRIAAKYSLGDGRDRGTEVKMVDRNGTPRFAEEMLRHAVWIQRRRTNPDAQIDDYDDGSWTDLARHLWAPAPLAPGPSRPKPKRT